MAFMFLRKTICVDFDRAFCAEIPANINLCYLYGYKFIVLLLPHAFEDFDRIIQTGRSIAFAPLLAPSGAH